MTLVHSPSAHTQPGSADTVVSLLDRQEERDARRLWSLMVDGNLEQAAAEMSERGNRSHRIAEQRNATTASSVGMSGANAPSLSCKADVNPETGES